MDLHPLLARQLQKAGLAIESLPADAEAWVRFVRRLDDSYRQADQDRYTVERSLEISSLEMQALYDDLRRSAADLARQHEMLASVIRSIGDGLLTLDADGRISAVNPAGMAMLGRTEQELCGRILIGELLPYDDNVELACALRDRRSVRLSDVRFPRADGRSLPTSCVLDPILRADLAEGFVLAFHDMTEARRIQAELESARHNAEAASRAKSEFLATMSHEIRTPLNGVIGNADLLRTTQLTAEQAECVQTIHGSGSTLLAIINDILDFSKIEAGRLELESLAFDPRAAVEETLEMLADAAYGKQVELLLDCARDVPRALIGDPWRFRQVLVNLIGNAVKYTPQGSVVVRLRARNVEDGGLALGVEVEDTGVGVPEPARARLFQPFSQGDSSNTRVYGGTGLGLAISRMLVERMGGSIRHEHAPVRGSIFAFEVRLRASPAGFGTDRAWISRARSALVIEPHAQARELLSRSLEELGLTTRTCAQWPERKDAAPSDEVWIVSLQAVVEDSAVASELERTVERGRSVLLVGPRRLWTHARECFAHPERLSWVAKPMRLSALQAWLAKPSAAPAATDLIPPALPSRGNRRLRVLVAEDNPVNQRLIQRMLERLDHHVELVDDGCAAVEAVLGKSYDLVLMDCQMPRMDGLEATRRIRALAAPGAQTPIVALTANAMTGDRETCLAAGMNGYLTKPIQLGQLESYLSRLFPMLSEAAAP